MFNNCVVTFIVLLLGILLWNFLCLRRNIRNAQSTGLKYIIVPWYIYNQSSSWLLNRTILRLSDKILPPRTLTSWRWYCTSLWPLRLRHAPFTAFGTDTFLTVAPGGIILNTADADLVDTITTRSTNFPKAVKIYGAIAMFGRNVVSTEGDEWRKHRKMTSLAFTERNNRLVWKETIVRMESMVKTWLGGNTVKSVASGTTRVSLDVLGRAGLGKQVIWPNPNGDGEEPETTTLEEGHTMSFSASLQYIAGNIISLALAMKISRLVRRCIMLFLPWRELREWMRKSEEAADNWRSYMKEMVAAKKVEMRSGAECTTDLISTLINSQNVSLAEKKQDLAIHTPLSDDEVMGNLFVFIVAGHETSASSMHMTILLLALHPEVQKQLQQELLQITQGKPPSEWDYDTLLPQLRDSFLYAVWSEELRLVSPILTIPKIVAPTPQEVVIDGKETVLPPNMIIRLCTSALHVNPRFWPHGPPTDPASPIFALDNQHNNLEEFIPSRWMKTSKNTTIISSSGDQLPNAFYSLPKTPTFKDQTRIYQPPRGSFIPFSSGKRACLGRRFAEVEILAALAVIFSQCSVELAVDEWACDEQVSSMSVEEKRELWEKAAENVRDKWQNGLESPLTVRLAKSKAVPMKFVRKGRERFF